MKSLPSTSSLDPELHRTVVSIRDDELRGVSPSPSAASNFRSRSDSLTSLSSLDSADSAEWGNLRVFTTGIKMGADYKTLRISNQTTCQSVVEQILNKFRLTCRDPNLFQLWMEVRTRRNGEDVKSLLELDRLSKPLELQRCQPANMSRFILNMASNGVLMRIYDYEISPASNYKSILVSRRTTCLETIGLVLQLNRIQGHATDYRLWLTEDSAEAQIPDEVLISTIHLNLLPRQKIVIKKV
uniref:Ras-associating domain-containing protein n=1 Tax=Acrobeloides nanus TaxID=290746 RepID=A0A914CFE9_9BILA